jgi:hypothetical protein
MKIVVRNWKYVDGWFDIPEVLRKSYGGLDREFREEIVGWYCWVYSDDERLFEKWMQENMKGYYHCSFRFKGGDVMHTVCIKDDEDATLFKLTWL